MPLNMPDGWKCAEGGSGERGGAEGCGAARGSEASAATVDAVEKSKAAALPIVEAS